MRGCVYVCVRMFEATVTLAEDGRWIKVVGVCPGVILKFGQVRVGRCYRWLMTK